MRGNGEFIQYTRVKDNRIRTHTVEMRSGLVFMKADVRRLESEQ